MKVRSDMTALLGDGGEGEAAEVAGRRFCWGTIFGLCLGSGGVGGISCRFLNDMAGLAL